MEKQFNEILMGQVTKKLNEFCKRNDMNLEEFVSITMLKTIQQYEKLEVMFKTINPEEPINVVFEKEYINYFTNSIYINPYEMDLFGLDNNIYETIYENASKINIHINEDMIDYARKLYSVLNGGKLIGCVTINIRKDFKDL